MRSARSRPLLDGGPGLTRPLAPGAGAVGPSTAKNVAIPSAAIMTSPAASPHGDRAPWEQEQGIEDERPALKPEDLGLRITAYLETGLVTETIVPDDYCDVAVPFA